MASFTFNPSLRLAGRPDVSVFTIDDAAEYVRNVKTAQRPISQAAVLQKLETASGLVEERDAANAFQVWVKAEGLLIEVK